MLAMVGAAALLSACTTHESEDGKPDNSATGPANVVSLAPHFAAAPEIGHGGPLLSVATGYRDHVQPTTALADLVVLDEMRTIDPCGLIDETSISAVGPARIVPAEPLERCVVMFDWPTKGKRANDVTVDIELVSPARARSSDQRPIEIAGRNASALTVGLCQFSIPIGQLTDGSTAAIVYTQGLDPDGREDCSVLEQMVGTSVRLIDTKPAPAAAVRGLAATADLCAALAAFVPNHTPYVVDGTSSYECAFILDRPDRYAEKIRILHSNTSRDQATSPSYPLSNGKRRVLVDGVPAVEDTSTGWCRIKVFVGLLRPLPPVDSSIVYDMNAVEVVGGSCDKIIAVTRAAVAVFQGR
ncbi:hypothetical protein AB0H49_24580 [Nocardia sp. NPDC050713]|uniref:hypothetical protein n=1 Tax=Nocardia sp. NPDC050713 TaxID=3154511 RepID=UPI00341029BD